MVTLHAGDVGTPHVYVTGARPTNRQPYGVEAPCAVDERLSDAECAALVDVIAWTDYTVADAAIGYRGSHLWESYASITSTITLGAARDVMRRWGVPL